MMTKEIMKELKRYLEDGSLIHLTQDALSELRMGKNSFLTDGNNVTTIDAFVEMFCGYALDLISNIGMGTDDAEETSYVSRRIGGGAQGMTETEERDEFEVQDELREKRRKIECLNDLFELIRDVKDNYNTGYGVAPRAIAQAAVATAYYLLSEMGCTGFQASFCMWDMVRDLQYPDNKAGLKMINYDLMLYPQYEDRFTEKTLASDQWATLQKEAQKYLDDDRLAHPNVVAHWQSIIDGNVPFGFSIKE